MNPAAAQPAGAPGPALTVKHVRRIADALMAPFAERLGTGPAEASRCVDEIGLGDELDINGFIRFSDDHRRFSIRIYRGMLVFLHKMLKLYLSRIHVGGSDGQIIERPKVSDAEMVGSARRLVAAYWNGEIMDTAGIGLEKLTENQMLLAAHLLHYAESFIVGHELGHALVELRPESVGREIGAAFAYLVTEPRECIVEAGFPSDRTDRILRDWSKEMVADLLGLELCLELASEGIPRVLVWSAADWVLALFTMLELYKARQDGSRMGSERHPPAQQRHRFLRHVTTDDEAAEARPAGLGLNEQSDYILASLEEASGQPGPETEPIATERPCR